MTYIVCECESYFCNTWCGSQDSQDIMGTLLPDTTTLHFTLDNTTLGNINCILQSVTIHSIPDNTAVIQILPQSGQHCSYSDFTVVWTTLQSFRFHHSLDNTAVKFICFTLYSGQTTVSYITLYTGQHFDQLHYTADWTTLQLVKKHLRLDNTLISYIILLNW